MTDIKGRPPDKGRQLSAAFGTCNPSFVCDLSQDGASRSSEIENGRQTRWLDTFCRLMFLIKKKPVPYKTREDGYRSETWKVFSKFYSRKDKSDALRPLRLGTNIFRSELWDGSRTLFRVIWKLPEERKSRYSSPRVVFYFGDKSLRDEYFSGSTRGRFAILKQFSYIYVIHAIFKLNANNLMLYRYWKEHTVQK